MNTENNIIRLSPISHQLRSIQKASEGRARLRPKFWRRERDGAELRTLNQLKAVACTTDLIWAWRYCYYVAKKPVVSDSSYDNEKAEEMEFGPGSPVLSLPATDRVCDYPDHIRQLACYLMYKKHWEGQIPYPLPQKK